MHDRVVHGDLGRDRDGGVGGEPPRARAHGVVEGLQAVDVGVGTAGQDVQLAALGDDGAPEHGRRHVRHPGLRARRVQRESGIRTDRRHRGVDSAAGARQILRGEDARAHVVRREHRERHGRRERLEGPLDRDGALLGECADGLGRSVPHAHLVPRLHEPARHGGAHR
ncbi:MAG: hypothetical protein RIA38_04710, partial [Microcella pacifica]